MRPKHTILTPQELEIMKLVWQREDATVRDVYQAQHRPFARHLCLSISLRFIGVAFDRCSPGKSTVGLAGSSGGGPGFLSFA